MSQEPDVPTSPSVEANIKDAINPPPGKTGFGFKRMILTLLTIACVGIAAWVVFINRLKPDFPVTQNPAGDVPLIVKTVDGLAEKKYHNCSV